MRLSLVYGFAGQGLVDLLRTRSVAVPDRGQLCAVLILLFLVSDVTTSAEQASVQNYTQFERLVVVTKEVLLNIAEVGLDEAGTRLLGLTGWKFAKKAATPVFNEIAKKFPAIFQAEQVGQIQAKAAVREAAEYFAQSQELRALLYQGYMALEQGQRAILDGQTEIKSMIARADQENQRMLSLVVASLRRIESQMAQPESGASNQFRAVEALAREWHHALLADDMKRLRDITHLPLMFGKKPLTSVTDVKKSYAKTARASWFYEKSQTIEMEFDDAITMLELFTDWGFVLSEENFQRLGGARSDDLVVIGSAGRGGALFAFRDFGSGYMLYHIFVYGSDEPSKVESANSARQPARPVAATILSPNSIAACVRTKVSQLDSALISARELLNSCFVSGRIPEEDFRRSEQRELALAKKLKLTLDDAQDIAEYGYYELFLEKHYVASRIFFEAMILLNPWNTYYHSMRGEIENSLGNYESALHSYSIAIETDSEDINALLSRGVLLLFKLERKAEARHDFEAASKLDHIDSQLAKRARRILRNHY